VVSNGLLGRIGTVVKYGTIFGFAGTFSYCAASYSFTDMYKERERMKEGVYRDIERQKIKACLNSFHHKCKQYFGWEDAAPLKS